MAEIDVKPKGKSSAIPWIIGLLLLGLLIWGVMQLMDDDADTVVVAEPYAPNADMPVAAPPSPAGQVGLATILASPSQYVGQNMPSMQVQVGEVPTDRGFWVQDETGQKLFAILIDQPAEKPLDINSGQTLQINGGTLRDAQYLGQITGEPLDSDTKSIAQSQQIYLVVNESNLNITKRN